MRSVSGSRGVRVRPLGVYSPKNCLEQNKIPRSKRVHFLHLANLCCAHRTATTTKHGKENDCAKENSGKQSPLPYGRALQYVLWTSCYLSGTEDRPVCRNAFNALDADTDHDGYRRPTGLGSTEPTGRQRAFASSYCNSYNFVPDSGCSRHCINDKSLFTRIYRHNPNINVRTASKHVVPVTAVGEVVLHMLAEDGSPYDVVLTNCLYVPSFHTNLLSIKQLWRENRIKTKFGERDYFKLRSGVRLYFDDTSTREHNVALRAAHGVPYDTIHKRLGHCGAQRLRLAASRSSGLDELHGYIAPRDCDACEQGGKSFLRPEKYRPRRAKQSPATNDTRKQYTYFGERISSDLCDFSRYTSAFKSYKFAVCFIDHYSGHAYVECLKGKDGPGVKAAFKRFIRLHDKWLKDGKVTEWHTDQGGEFCNNDLDDFCEEISTRRTYSLAYDKNKNAKAERLWGLLLRPMRAMFADSNLPHNLWPECLQQAVLLHNSLPTRRHENNMSPHECLTGELPDLSKFRVFGCKVTYNLPPTDVRGKLGDQTATAIHLGLHPQISGYRVYVPSLRRLTAVKYRSRFNESVFPQPGSFIGAHELEIGDDGLPANDGRQNAYRRELPQHDPQLPTVQQGGTPADQQGGVPLQVGPARGRDIPTSAERRANGDLRRNATGQHNPHNPHRQNFLPEIYTQQYSADGHSSKYLWVYAGGWSRTPLAFEAEIESIPTPTTYDEAINGEFAIRWKASMQQEISTLLKHRTWDLVPRSSVPRGRRPLKSKWVYRIKFAKDGTIDKFKSRLVVCGYSQREGVDYDQCFSATLRATSFRLLLALSAWHKFELEHLDVTSAFTQAALDDVDIWVEPARGFESYDKDGNSQVYKLKQALYGTKQASRLWQQTLRHFLLDQGFTSSLSDPCLFQRRRNGAILLVAIYVDDIVCAHNKQAEFNQFNKDFCTRFRANYLGKLEWFLGMSIDRGPDGEVMLGHQKYIEDMVDKFVPDFRSNCILGKTPVTSEAFTHVGCAEDDAERQKMRKFPYMELIGSLLYLSTMSRPDICYYLSKLCRHMSDPNQHCWTCAISLLLYLYNTRELKIKYSYGKSCPDGLYKAHAEIANNMGFHAFSDSSWNVPSPSYGFCLFLANGPISFASKTIKTADSSCEAEYTAASKAARDIHFVRTICEDLGFLLRGRLALAVDNTAAIDVARNMGTTARNKHFERETHYVREQYERRRINLHHVPTAKQTADIFTKALDPTNFQRHCGQILRKC